MAVINGTPGADALPGTVASETINGGAGNDTITGGPGNDLLKGGAGNDRFIWAIGDGNDRVDGGLGFDTLTFNAGPGADTFALTANSGHVRLTTDVGPTTLDLNDVERVQINASIGADTVTVNNLAGTDVKEVAVNLGAPDAAPNLVVVNAGAASNAITLSKTGSVVSVTGLSAKTTVAGFESTDSLIVNAQGGNDSINASALPFATLRLTLDGSGGNDKITGSKGEDGILGGTGNDTVAGGRGDDTVDLGAGNDLFLWTTGDGNDEVQGKGGFDTLRYSGNKSDEVIAIGGSGGDAFLDWNATVEVDTFGIERLVVDAGGGADNIWVSDLTASDVKRVDINLAADGKVDTMGLIGQTGADSLSVRSVNGKVVSDSLGATATFSTAENSDKFIIDGSWGNDHIDASELAAGLVRLRIEGSLGDDTMFGSLGNDIVVGGVGNDTAFLGAGNDRFIWNVGDGNDTINGQGGIDTLQINGSSASDVLFFDAGTGGRMEFSDFSPSTTYADGIERIEVHDGAGPDSIMVSDLTGTDVKQVVVKLTNDGTGDTVSRIGTTGDDTITIAKAGSLVSVSGLSAQLTVAGGGSVDLLEIVGLEGNDRIDASKMPAGTLTLSLVAGSGNDTVIGGAGNDSMFGGLGNDLFLWNPGQGSDAIFGDPGFDTLRLTGAAASEIIGIAADVTHVVLTRNLGAVSLDTMSVERLQVRALGGADRINIGDLTGTFATQVDVDLAALAGGTKADGKVDTVTLAGIDGGIAVAVTNSGAAVVVEGYPAKVNITHADKTDRLVLNGGAGNDLFEATFLAAGKVALQLSGGAGNDSFTGSAGNDTVTGGTGNDTAWLGVGNDLFIWNPGDGNDIVDGQAGTDTLRFNGDANSEVFLIAPDSGRVDVARSIDSVLLDLDGVERIQLNALRGADKIFVNDLSGTDVKQVSIDLGASDGAADTVLLSGRTGNDIVTVAVAGLAVTVTGLAAQVSVTHPEGANDLLEVNLAQGNDTINASALPAGVTRLWLEGAEGNDTMTGSAGNDRLDGDDNNDVLNGGGGRDTIYGGSGNDTINGGTGADSIQGDEGNDRINGGAGNDTITGGAGNDTIDVSLGNDIVRYTSTVDGRDVITGFDGNAAGGQDVLDLDLLFDELGVLGTSRAGRVSIVDSGASVQVRVDTNGDLSFDLAVATLKTTDAITIGHDVLLGS
jgi:Ca2+-binding RTX toxin-like protein